MLVTLYILGGGGTRHFFILTFYNSKTIGGGGEALAHPASPVPQSLRLEGRLLLCICVWFSVQVRALDKMKSITTLMQCMDKVSLYSFYRTFPRKG